MTHPSEYSLSAWLDGETEGLAERRAIEAHLASCARCRQWMNSTTALGGAVRTWADDMSRLDAGDLADAVLRSEPRIVPTIAHGQTIRRRGHRSVPRVVVAAFSLAVAAAGLFAFRSPIGRSLGWVTPATAHDAGIGPTATRAKPAPGTRGTEVLSIEPAAHSVYSVMEVPGEVEGTTTSVVWIDEASPSPQIGE